MRQSRTSVFRTVLLFLVLCMFSCSVVHAADATREYQLKAGFLVNFFRFITWPEQSFASQQADFVFCVVGESPFGSALNGVGKKKIGQRNIRVIYADSLKNVPPCHLLYVSDSEEKDIGNLFTILGNRPTVSVSDIAGFARAGGSIEFMTRNSRLSFIINYSEMKQRNVQPRASLLDLAASVL